MMAAGRDAATAPRRGRDVRSQGEPIVSILVIDVGTSGVGRRRCGPTPPWRWSTTARSCPTPRWPGWSSSTPTCWPTWPSSWPPGPWPRPARSTAVGITNQRASTIVWDRATGEPVGPALGWQDLRTVDECLVFQADGLRFAPNQSATKVAWLLNTYDPDRTRDLCFGTPDTWIAWRLSGGELHVTDLSNAAVTGLIDLDGGDWDDARARPSCASRASMMPTIVDSTGRAGAGHRAARARRPSPASSATSSPRCWARASSSRARPRSPSAPAACSTSSSARSGRASTPGAGAGRSPSWPGAATASPRGASRRSCCRPAPTSSGCATTSASSTSSAESHDVASQCDSTDGVVYVPALMGLGTPHWDYGARGTLLGLTRGAGRPQIVRAVLEGVAQRGRRPGRRGRDRRRPHHRRRAHRRRHEPQPDVRAGAGRRHPAPRRGLTRHRGHHPGGRLRRRPGPRHLGAGSTTSRATWAPTDVVEPGEPLDRERWADAVRRAGAWFPELSGLDF